MIINHAKNTLFTNYQNLAGFFKKQAKEPFTFLWLVSFFIFLIAVICENMTQLLSGIIICVLILCCVASLKHALKLGKEKSKYSLQIKNLRLHIENVDCAIQKVEKQLIKNQNIEKDEQQILRWKQEIKNCENEIHQAKYYLKIENLKKQLDKNQILIDNNQVAINNKHDSCKQIQNKINIINKYVKFNPTFNGMKLHEQYENKLKVTKQKEEKLENDLNKLLDQIYKKTQKNKEIAFENKMITNDINNCEKEILELQNLKYNYNYHE